MQDNQLVTSVVQKQATVGDIIEKHLAGQGMTQIAEEFGLDPAVVFDVIQKANAEGRFIPQGKEGDEDFMGEKVQEPEVKGKATTKSDPSL